MVGIPTRLSDDGVAVYLADARAGRASIYVYYKEGLIGHTFFAGGRIGAKWPHAGARGGQGGHS